MAGSAKKSQSSLMRFVGNKNVVTILGIAACIAILVIGYAYRVNNSVATQSVPFARKSLEARSVISDGDVGNVRISSSYVSSAGNVITDAAQVYGKAVAYYTNIPGEVVGMWSNPDSVIPAGSLFYSSQVMDPAAIPNAAFKDIGEGNTIYSLKVDEESTYANSIRAGEYIDLYMATKDPSSEDLIY